jgi:hypothetical protein
MQHSGSARRGESGIKSGLSRCLDGISDDRKMPGGFALGSRAGFYPFFYLGCVGAHADRVSPDSQATDLSSVALGQFSALHPALARCALS